MTTGRTLASGRYSQLSHWGAFTAVVEHRRFVRAESAPFNPWPSPMLRSMPAMVYSPLRINRPAVRKGWLDKRNRSRSGDANVFVEVAWDTALELVATELTRVRAERGAAGMFGGSYGWSSAGRVHHARTHVRRFLFAGGGCVDQIGNYSWGAAQTLLPHVIGTYEPVTGKVTTWPSIIAHCQVFVAFGGLPLRNAQITSGGGGEHTLPTYLRAAKAAGVKFINISPNRADMPEWLDAQWIPIRPNTDTALMLAMAHELITRDLHDVGFLARHCAGFEQLKAYILGVGVEGCAGDVARTPEWAAPICGVEAATIRELAQQLHGTRSMLSFAWALQRAHRGEQPFWMGIALAAMLGTIGLPGGGFSFGHASSNAIGVPRPPIPGPEMSAGRNPASAHDIPVAHLSEMLLRPGAEYEFNGATRQYSDIGLVYWAGGNPYHHHQDVNQLMRAWEKPETVIVHDSHWTATARRADIVLPATTTLERSDIGGGSRDRFIIAMQQAIEPVGLARNDYAIFGDLAARLGYAEAFCEKRNAAAWVQLLYARQREAAAAAGITLPDHEVWQAQGYAELPKPERDFILFEAFRADPESAPLSTPSGRIELFSERIAAMQYDDCPGHPAWLMPDECLASPPSAWPLHLISTQPAEKLHSQGDFAHSASRVAGHTPLYLNPVDAAARGIRSGDTVRIFNQRGATLGGALIEPGLMAGVAAMPTGSWLRFAPDGTELSGNPNMVSLIRATSRLTQGCAALTARIEVCKEGG